MILRLCIFDFDGTLFNSPQPPDWWKDPAGWFYIIESMTPPCLAEVPSDDWWVESTVKEVRDSLSDESNYVVLLTGRQRTIFSERVHELLGQKDLKFDEVHLSDRVDTVDFKVECIKRMLSEHPTVEIVEMWDDMFDRIPPCKAVVESAGVKFKLHKVDMKERKSPCTEDEFLTNKVASRYVSLV